VPAAEQEAAVVFTVGVAGVVNCAEIENVALAADAQEPFDVVIV
jgi:hypothetical protein